MKRHTAKLQATPCWADLKKISAIYQEAAETTRATGIVHHVDHVVPLRSRLVCGLHVEANLRVLPARENQKKSNKLVEV